ncbi:MAG: hypothetical protein Crog4KO_36700 [Crocinitomicaceae bacterium]
MAGLPRSKNWWCNKAAGNLERGWYFRAATIYCTKEGAGTSSSKGEEDVSWREWCDYFTQRSFFPTLDARKITYETAAMHPWEDGCYKREHGTIQAEGRSR